MTDMTDEVDDFLAHYGVKGMKWGERRAAKKQVRTDNANKAREAGYSTRARNYDMSNVGKKGVRKIEARVAAGESVRKAKAKVYTSTMLKGYAVGTAMMATPFALAAGTAGLQSLANSVNAKRGAAAAATLLADTRGLTSYSTVALAFDAASKTWK